MCALFSAASLVSRRLLTVGGQVSPIRLDVGNHSFYCRLPIADCRFENLQLSYVQICNRQLAIGNTQTFGIKM
jgi:hypothetical protein